MTRFRWLWMTVILSLGSWLTAGSATASNCTAANVTLFSVTPANFGNYSPYATAPLTVTFLVTIGTNANCTNLFFGMSAAGGTFAPAAPALSYSILGTVPLLTNPDKINVSNTTVTFAYTARINPGQIAPAGYHSTAAGVPIRLNLFLRQQGALIQPAARSLALDASVIVIAGCDLPAPNLSNVDFTAALTSGVPNPGVVRSITFAGASCVAPARIRLSGAALQPSAPMPVRPGFDTLINWSAAANFGLASATLNTSGTTPSQATSLAKNSNSVGATSGNISVNINLLAGTRPQAGSYSGILTVTIDPLF